MLDLPTAAARDAACTTDLEARFRLRMFALLGSPPALRQLVQHTSAASGAARLDLGRFLAAYFLGTNFARLFAHLNRCAFRHQIGTEQQDNNNCNATTTTLPSLLVCAELEAEGDELEQYNEERASTSATEQSSWSRARLGQLLPPECTPALALRLLLRERRLVEAIFFADHFQDARTALALRFLADRQCPYLHLFPAYCHSTLVTQLLEAIESAGANDGPDEEQFHRRVEAIICADALFPEEFGANGLLNECLQRIVALMADQFAALLELDAFIDGAENQKIRGLQAFQARLAPLLPRPPIYCAASTVCTNQQASTSSAWYHHQNGCANASCVDGTETRAWLLLHECCSVLTRALARSNRLQQLVGFFALWLAQEQQFGGADAERQRRPMSEVPFLLEAEFFTGGHTDAELQVDLQTMQTLLSVVLGMHARDQLARSLQSNGAAEFGANGQNANATQKCHAKFNVLAGEFLCRKEGGSDVRHDTLIWSSLIRWAQLADPFDIENAQLFLHTIQQENASIQRSFLPPLNALNRPKWCSLLLMEEGGFSANVGMERDGCWLNHLEVFVEERHKFKLNNADFVRLRFLSKHFPLVPLDDAARIQMLLPLDLQEICSLSDGVQQKPAMYSSNLTECQKIDLNTDFGAKNENLNEAAASDDALGVLIDQIRTTLARLGDDTAADDQKQQQKEKRNETEFQDSEAEHLQAIRQRLQHELDRHARKKKPESSAASDSVVPRSKHRSSDWLSSHSTASSRFRTNRRRTMEKRHERRSRSSTASSSSGVNTQGTSAAEEPSDTQLMREMDDIERRLERIREHFEQKSTAGAAVNGEEEECSMHASIRSVAAPEVGVNASGRRSIDKERSPSLADKSAEGADNVERSAASGKRTSVQSGTRRSGQTDDSASGSGGYNNVESRTRRTEMGSDLAKRRASIKNSEPDQLNGQIEEASTYKAAERKFGIQHGEPQSVLEPSDKTAFGLASTRTDGCCSDPRVEREADVETVYGSSPASSAGYHSSRPSTHSADGAQNANNEQALSATHARHTPPVIERMDFRGLRSSSEEDEAAHAGGDGQQVGQAPKKAKRRLWTEIEVMPRNSPSLYSYAPPPPASARTKTLSKSTSRSSGSDNIHAKHPTPGTAPTLDALPQVVAAVEQPQRRVCPWRRPQWLRLLPPFDGTIRTERRAADAPPPRPLLELKLDDLHYASPHGRGTAGTALNSLGTDLNYGSNDHSFATRQRQLRRTILEAVAKRKAHDAALAVAQRKRQHKAAWTMNHHQLQRCADNTVIYDSGIGLDQHNQPQHSTSNGTVPTAAAAGARGGAAGRSGVLYSADLSDADVEAMRAAQIARR